MEEGKNYQDVLDAADLEAIIPTIAGRYRKTSEATIDYNCLAWAIGAQWAWFDPEPGCIGYFWPAGIEREWSVTAIKKVLAHFGFKQESFDDFSLEEGFIKVAVYLDEDKVPVHFARQLDNGKWTSKCGELIDIEHDTLDCLNCKDYGAAEFAMKRKVVKAI